MALTDVDKVRLSKEDQDRILAYTKAWEEANAKGDKAAMAQASAQAKAIRENSGYTSNPDGTYKTSNNTPAEYQATSAYKGTGYLQEQHKNTNDWQTIDLGGGKTTRYSQSLADSKNATAYIPGVGEVRVTIKDGKTQETSLPAGTIVTPDGSQQSWQINGATADGYTSELYTGALPSSERYAVSSSSPGTYANNYSSNGNIYESIYNQQQQALLEAQRQAEEAQRLAVQRGVNTLNAQKAGINQQTNEALKQAYINDMVGNRNLEQLMKAQGLTGGMTESSMLDKRAAYENILNSTRQAGNNMLNQIDTDIANLQTTGDFNIANLASEYGVRLADLLGTNLERQIAQMNADRAYNYQVGRDEIGDNRYNQQWQYQLDRDNISDQRYNQQWQYQLDRDIIGDQRYNTEYQDKLKQQAYENELRRLASISSGTGTNKNNKPTSAAYNRALELLEDGIINQDVISIIEGYTGQPFNVLFPSITSNGNMTGFSDPTLRTDIYSDSILKILGIEKAVPYPNPQSPTEVLYNASYLKNQGYDFNTIKAYAQKYNVDLKE